MIIIIDFGSQTAHLIGRRFRDLGIETKLIEPEDALGQIEKYKPKGIILSGGPASVYEKGAPTISKKVFELGIPVLGIVMVGKLWHIFLEVQSKILPRNMVRKSFI